MAFVWGDFRWTRVDSSKWHWLEDYVMAQAKYVILCPPNRVCEYGSGVFMGGAPRGDRNKWCGGRLITCYGAGAVHVRTADGNEPCLVGISQRGFTVIPVAYCENDQWHASWDRLREAWNMAHSVYERLAD